MPRTTARADTHVHVFDPRRFPYSPQRSYTPGAAPVQDLIRHLERIGCERVVCVQPSVYGYDHACLLDALRALQGAGVQARGAAVLGPGTTGWQIEALHEAGVRAARINWQVPTPDHDPMGDQDHTLAHAVQALHERLGERPWAIEVFARLPVLLEAAPALAAIDRPVIIDHFGLPNLRNSDDTHRLLQLLEANPQLSLKVSAPYQVSRQEPDYGDLAPLVRRLGQAAPAQLLWGSNWPHTSGTRREAPASGDHGVEPFRYENDVRTLGLLTQYLDDDSAATAMMCRNPARVFDYA